MSNYIIGDIHGCYDEFRSLLKKIKFNHKKDVLWITGDIVSRGPHSLKTLRYIKKIENSVKIVLGNHELYLIKIHNALKKNKENITNQFNKDILLAPDIDEIIYWIKKQPLFQIDKNLKIIMIHAGISPQWDLKIMIKCAKEIKEIFQNEYKCNSLIPLIFDDKFNNWETSKLNRKSRFLFAINTFTRIRYCNPDGKLDMKWKGKYAPHPLKPWFNFPRKINKTYSIVFGHWSAIKGKGTPKGIYGLDTGCCWGGDLTILRWEDKRFFHQKFILKNQNHQFK